MEFMVEIVQNYLILLTIAGNNSIRFVKKLQGMIGCKWHHYMHNILRTRHLHTSSSHPGHMQTRLQDHAN